MDGQVQFRKKLWQECVGQPTADQSLHLLIYNSELLFGRLLSKV